MEKIDLINQQDNKSFRYEFPDVSKMFRLKVDSRTMFYFSTTEKRKRFINKRYDRKLNRFNIDSEY
nr:MAG TPA: hypothetical protein [Caudoviricetes sp.]